MIAYQICEKVKTKIQEEVFTGRVHSVFNRSFNIITSDNKLLSVLSNERSIAPLSIVLKEKYEFPPLGISRDMEVSFRNNKIILEDVERSIDLEEAIVWNPQPIVNFMRDTEESVLCKLIMMEDHIHAEGKLNGIAPLAFNIGEQIQELRTFYKREIPLDVYNRFIFKRFMTFIKVITQHDIARVAEVTRGIIGFGPGLTPSVDDFISGLMISLVYLYTYFNLDLKEVYGFNSKIIGTIKGKTTRVSETMLKLASCGETSEVTRRCMISLLTPSSHSELISGFKKIIEVGETSGTDTLCGIYMGFKIMFHLRSVKDKTERGLISEKPSGNQKKYLL